MLGVREIASLWHPPGAGDETPLVERSGARALSPSAKGTRGGALVGDTTAGARREIRFPEDLLRRHHLYVARTRMGKSTLMHHVVTHKMQEKAAGRDGDAIVVVDPHTDLVAGILEHVPESLADRVRLIDLSDESRAPGINLPGHPHLLRPRPHRRLGGARGEGPLGAVGAEDAVHPRADGQGPSTRPTSRWRRSSSTPSSTASSSCPTNRSARTLLKKVSDPYLLEWWASTFTGWSRDYKADSLAPVQTRLSYYASSKRARAILGQRRSTIDLRRVIHDGGILLVSTSQGTVGRDVAALVGASLLNLVDAVIREQGRLPLSRRRGALVVVDEMSVDARCGLREHVVRAGQVRGELHPRNAEPRQAGRPLTHHAGHPSRQHGAVSPSSRWRGTTQGHWCGRLGKERVTEDDITSLPVHQCYVRATVGKERMPAFSMMVRKPEEGEPDMASRIRADASAYTVSAREGDYADADGP